MQHSGLLRVGRIFDLAVFAALAIMIFALALRAQGQFTSDPNPVSPRGESHSPFSGTEGSLGHRS
jgi:hypothetical protein